MRRLRAWPCGAPRLAILCGLVVAAIGLLVAPTAGATPRIAFAKYESHGKQSHIWSISPGAPHARQLTSGTPYDLAPAWSPDRGTIAFIRFTSGDSFEGPSLLMLMRADGSSERPLTYEGPTLTTGTHALAYSPDGRFLAGGLKVTPDETGSKWALTVLDLHSGVSRIVRRYSSQGGIESLSWSPDGRQIAFTVEYGGGSGLLRVDVESGRRLAIHTGAFNTSSVSWSPRGGNLLCSVFRLPGSPLLTYLTEPDGSRLERLGSGQGDPAYSPDGRHYAFVQRGKWGYPCVIKYADADGSDVKTVLKSSGKDYIAAPAWR